MSPLDNNAERPPETRLRRVFGNLAWVMAGVVLAIVLIANPLHIHSLDTSVHALVDRWHVDLAQAVDYGAVQRIRPKMLTVTAILASLIPILWATGTGADVMRRIAAPMVGGVLTSFFGELVVYPSIYFVLRSPKVRRSSPFPGPGSSPLATGEGGTHEAS